MLQGSELSTAGSAVGGVGVRGAKLQLAQTTHAKQLQMSIHDRAAHKNTMAAANHMSDPNSKTKYSTSAFA